MEENLAKIISALIKNYKKIKDEEKLNELSNRIDILYAAEKLTKEEYESLTKAI